MRSIIKIILLCAVFCGISPMPAQDIGRETRIDAVLASVDGRSITLLDVMLESSRDEMRLANLYTGERLYSETAKLRKRIIEDLITRKLVFEDYKARPFDIDNQYIESMIDILAGNLAGGSRDGLLKKARSMGTNMTELREKMKEKIAVDIMFMEYCDRRVSVTPKDVYLHYQSNPAEWTTPETFVLQLLLIAKSGARSGVDPKMTCEELKKRILPADETKFTELVKEYSDAPNPEKGGFTPPVPKTSIRPEFAPLLETAKEGDRVGPVETMEGYYFIRVASIAPEKKLPFEQAAPMIRAKLESSGKMKKRQEYAEKLKSNALIRFFY